jgi:hypothetical protein
MVSVKWMFVLLLVLSLLTSNDVTDKVDDLGVSALSHGQRPPDGQNKSCGSREKAGALCCPRCSLLCCKSCSARESLGDTTMNLLAKMAESLTEDLGNPERGCAVNGRVRDAGNATRKTPKHAPLHRATRAILYRDSPKHAPAQLGACTDTHSRFMGTHPTPTRPPSHDSCR